MLNIVCIRAGEAFSPEYVEILRDMVRRNLAEGYKGRFICFTDRPQDLQGIETRPLPADLPGWWSKLALFKKDLFPAGDRILFFDLDTVITDSFDRLADYSGPFAILRDFYRPQGLQSAVMAWEAGECSDIWESYEAAGCPQDISGGDQAWIERGHLIDAVRLQDVFPDLLVSYKLTKGIPDKASIVVFHGRPRPHEVGTGWVPDVWKVDGLSGASLKTVCNTEREKIMANVRSAMERDLPWFDFDNSINDEHVVLIGGGPSIAETVGEIEWRKSIGQKIWALNGTAKWLRARGIVPDAHVVVDARPENVAFTEGASDDTVHYIASQVHPSVLDALRSKQVVLWHSHTEGMDERLKSVTDKPVHLIGGGSTVGMQAICLAYLKGHRTIHLHGFDSSYKDGAHHAYQQTLNDSDKIITAMVGDRKFVATPQMVQQANEFQDLAFSLAQDGVTFTVAGDGLLPYMARNMTVPLSAADIRADEVLKRVNGSPDPKGAEIGVFAGDMSAALLRNNHALKLYMVDSWEGAGAAYSDGSDWHAGLTQAAQDDYKAKAISKTAFASDRREVIAKRSTEAAAAIEDGSLDFVFIDADHSYEGCKADIESWLPKVKESGWLCGHDFAHPEFPEWGVEKAVREFAEHSGLSLELGDNMTWFIRIVKQPSSVRGNYGY